MIDIRDYSTLDILPEALKREASVQAASWALRETARILLDKIDRTMVYAGIDLLPEEIVDLLAVEFRAQYYDGTMSLEKKRQAVKKALQWYKKAGTPYAVHELTDMLYGEHEIHEWFEYDGSPYTFRIEIMGLDVLITDEGMENYISALQKVKNTRSLLETIIFHRRADLGIYSGAAAPGYMRQVIVDFWTEGKTDEFKLNSGAGQAHFRRHAIVDHFDASGSA